MLRFTDYISLGDFFCWWLYLKSKTDKYVWNFNVVVDGIQHFSFNTAFLRYFYEPLSCVSRHGEMIPTQVMS